jgi:predicted glycosyltransferase
VTGRTDGTGFVARAATATMEDGREGTDWVVIGGGGADGSAVAGAAGGAGADETAAAVELLHD